MGYGDEFPNAQVSAAADVWRILTATYPIIRANAMVQHSELDPDRKSDPGPVWMNKHAPGILTACYGD